MAETGGEAESFDFQGALGQLNQEASWSLSDQELTEIFRARAAALARSSERELVRTGAMHLKFSVHDVSFGVELARVRAISVPHWMTSVPGAPEHLARVFQVGGRIVSLLDLGALFDLPRAKSESQRAVLLEQRGSTLGILAHRVLGIFPIDSRDLSPSSASSRGTEFVTGIASDMTLVLDAPRLLSGLRFESTQTA